MTGIDNNAFNPSAPQHIKRFIVNRQLRMLLGKMPVNTVDARMCIVDQGDIYAWMHLIENAVIPLFVKYGIQSI